MKIFLSFFILATAITCTNAYTMPIRCWMYLAPAKRAGSMPTRVRRPFGKLLDRDLYDKVRALEIDRQIANGYKTSLAPGTVKFLYVLEIPDFFQEVS